MSTHFNAFGHLGAYLILVQRVENAAIEDQPILTASLPVACGEVISDCLKRGKLSRSNLLNRLLLPTRSLANNFWDYVLLGPKVVKKRALSEVGDVGNLLHGSVGEWAAEHELTRGLH